MRKVEFTVIFLSIISTTVAIQTVYMDSNYDPVTKTILGSAALQVKLTRGSTYDDGEHYQLTIDTSSSDRLMIQFNDLSIEYDDACASDWLAIYDGNSKQADMIGKRFCGQVTPSYVYTSSGHAVTLYFKSDESAKDSGFDIIITPYHTGYCHSYEYDCDNGRCVDNSLTCNGHNPCGDNSDCSVTVSTSVTGISVGSTVSVIVVVIIVVCVVRRRRRMVLVRAPAAPSTTVTMVNNTTVHQPHAMPAPVGYSQPPPQPYGPVAHPPQPMTAYPPPAYPGQAPKY